MKEVAAIWEDINILVPWDQNPRHNQASIKYVADSIKRFGFASPIIARSADKMVIAGHTRLEAAKLLKLDKVPVRYLEIDPADAKMLALADNRIGQIASWDDEALSEILSELKEEDLDLDVIGFSPSEIDSLLEEQNIYEAPDSQELDASDFDNFDHTCPRCGFEYND